MTLTVAQLQAEIEQLAKADLDSVNIADAKALVGGFLDALESGEVRAASRQPDGSWKVHAWVKQGILLCFRLGKLTDYSINRTFQFRDKDTLPPQDMTGRAEPPRVVPGGTAVRTGAFLGRKVVIMPPSYVNIGAYIDDETMVDSHALVGSCAQIGKRVHLSAGAQIGGVLEPVEALPVIIEDDVFIGAQSGVFEGTLVGKGATLGAGVILTRSTPVYDLVREEIYRGDESAHLVIPERAIVVPGARPARGDFAERHKISIQTPVIVGYRQPGESGPLSLETALH